MTTIIKGSSGVSLDYSTGGRITGDFSNATVANRAVFQSSTTNGNTNLNAIPNGTSQQAVLGAFNNSDPTNASATSVLVNASESSVRAGILGTGTYLPMTFYTGGSERMRIDTSGNLLVGNTGNPGVLAIQGSTSNVICSMYNNNASPVGLNIYYGSAAPNGTGNLFLNFNDTVAARMQVRSNGGIANFSANNVNLSDERTKTDIVNAGSYLDKICAIPVRTFKYKDQTDGLLNLGVIAQEVEAVAPELVDISGFGETPEDGIPLKAIYQTDLQYALMKCIQEQQAIIEQLQADVAALKGQA